MIRMKEKILEQGFPTNAPGTTSAPGGRASGNDFRFPDFASHTGRFRIIIVRISSVVSFRVDIRQLSLTLICHK